MAIIWPTTSIFFPEDVKNQVRKLIGGRKVGVTQEKTGIRPQKWWNKGKIVDNKPFYHRERSKNNQG